jgi:hypothetical protein
MSLSVLDETNIGGVQLEAVTARVEAVLSDQTSGTVVTAPASSGTWAVATWSSLTRVPNLCVTHL